MRTRLSSLTLLAAALLLTQAGAAHADLTIRAVHVRDGASGAEVRFRQDERIELTATRRRTDDSTSYVFLGKGEPPRMPASSAMTEVVALDQGVLWGWAPDSDGYREALLTHVRSQRGALWSQVLAPELDPHAAIEAGADTLGPYATPVWKLESGKRTIAGLAVRRVVANWLEAPQDSVVLEAWIAPKAPGAAERAAFDAGARQAMLLDPLLPLGIADQWGPAWLRVTRVLRAAGGMMLALRVQRFRLETAEGGGEAARVLALEDRFEVLEISTRPVPPGRFQIPASKKLLE